MLLPLRQPEHRRPVRPGRTSEHVLRLDRRLSLLRALPWLGHGCDQRDQLRARDVYGSELGERGLSSEVSD